MTPLQRAAEAERTGRLDEAAALYREATLNAPDAAADRVGEGVAHRLAARTLEHRLFVGRQPHADSPVDERPF
jgi:predicted Zn-dependent protease with MMP-like domain